MAPWSLDTVIARVAVDLDHAGRSRAEAHGAAAVDLEAQPRRCRSPAQVLIAVGDGNQADQHARAGPRHQQQHGQPQQPRHPARRHPVAQGMAGFTSIR
jgi:hypothetical protein